MAISFLTCTPIAWKSSTLAAGRLTLDVTPQNILHASRRRNEGLACVFHDLGLMEKEGSGFDMLYDRLLSSGRPAVRPQCRKKDRTG